MTAFSILDLAPVPSGSSIGQALHNTIDLARHAERLGYKRYWLAEHHNMPGIASAATSVVIGAVAAATKTIRVGAGGVMLPNHAPLVIAEQFGTLAALYPGRIDLGLGRAPGTDQMTARALRRTLQGDVDSFPQDVMELMRWFDPVVEGQRIAAYPGEGQDVKVWVLGSSTYGAQLAAHLGLPYAFASHFAPGEMMRAIDIYRQTFRPSAALEAPYVMLGYNAFVADSDVEAHKLFSSVQQAFVNLRLNKAGKLPMPVEGYYEGLDGTSKAVVDSALSCAAVGAVDTVRETIKAFVEKTGADELMVTSQIWDPQARVRSLELLAEAVGLGAV
ncbi:LLM class flavin-dependent oxidoreductase [Brevundimonas terrae]|uniref:LLM class flavin-dependent oxidoreductase n=1 Tax=Brevundimonas terrae TaxID=363631 RepID=A0ABN0Y5U6_9CAUL|nr:LLM class flavin-dependent oxidoreductase [Brevundimonas terrae]NIJ25649.1 luciferase family oxidoreductase group 1 [Brevundimonas terrae]